MMIRATKCRKNDDGSCNVSVSVSTGDLAGAGVHGDVTIMPRVDGRPGYEACGDSVDMWVSRGVLSLLERELSGGELSESLGDLVAVAGAYVDEHP